MTMTVLNSFTISFVFTTIIYLILYKHVIKKMKLSNKISTFMLIGWFLMLIQITIFSNTFISAIGGEMNLHPLHTITEDLFTYGQLDILKQFLLNVFMFLPFGLLYFYRKQKKPFLYTTVIGFTITLSIELTQFFIGRTFDIDDIIANFIGVVLGISYCCIYKSIQEFINGKRRFSVNKAYGLLAIVLTILLIIFPLYSKAVISKNANGFFLYTHERPTEIIYKSKLNDKTGNGYIYDAVPAIAESQFNQILMSNFKIDLSKFHKTVDNAAIYETNALQLIFRIDGTMDLISKDHNIPFMKANMVSDDYQTLALCYLKNIYGNDEIFKSAKFELRDTKEKKEVVVRVNTLLDDKLYFGKIFVDMTASGELLQFDSTVVKGKIKQAVKLKSNRQTSKVINKTGNFNKKLKVTVTTIEKSYYYNKKAKTLTPTWNFEGWDHLSNVKWVADLDATLK